MSGTLSTLKDEIKKLEHSKKKDKFKLLSTIIVSNIFVAVLFYINGPSSKDSTDLGQTKTVTTKITHQNHQILELPLKLYFSEKILLNAETPVSLISEEGKVLIKKAFLHDLTKEETLDVPAKFKIEISNLDLLKVHQKTGEVMIAIPYVDEKKVANKHLESKYEMHF